MSNLPVVKIGNKSYFMDLQLFQLRNVHNPHDYLNFGNEECLNLFLEANDEQVESVPAGEVFANDVDTLDLLEELLAITGRFKARMDSEECDRWQAISAKVADLRDGEAT